MESANYMTRALINRKRRQRQVRRNIMKLIISAFIIVAASVLFVSFSTKANVKESQPAYKYYKSVEIAKGDTLWSIANENMDSEHYKNIYEYINEVKKMNSLTSDKITVGNHIIVPYYSSELIMQHSEETIF